MAEIVYNPKARFGENNPAFWRWRAEELRTTAESLNDPVARQHMLAAAISYDRLAEMVEKQTKSAEYWRDRAEEARIRASDMTEEESQKALIKIADQYDKLAQIAEREEARAATASLKPASLSRSS